MLSVVLPPPRPSRSTPPFFGVSAAIASALASMVEIARLEAPSAAARPINSRRETAPFRSRPFQYSSSLILQFPLSGSGALPRLAIDRAFADGLSFVDLSPVYCRCQLPAH